ncbi:MAG: hypothetical protein LBC73_09130 [Oscillospiraceae bacterium]|jgi:translation elongation factor EF-1alpha|nr:hypothetical protein [Oscillospiraceae bacterium]
MKKNIVFYGNANHGKSTLIGYIVAELNPKIDLDKMEKYFRREFGDAYNPKLLYTWLVNKDKYKAGVIPNELTGILVPIKVINETGESINNALRSVSLEINNESMDFTFIDTPGQHPETRDKVLQLGEVGVFCVEIGQVLDEEFSEEYFEKYEIWSKFSGEQPIVLLTKIDAHFTEKKHNDAVEKIKLCCNYDDPIIIPTAVLVSERRSLNVFQTSQDTFWYEGDTVIDAIKKSVQV